MEWWIPCCWGNEMRFCEVQKQSGGVQMGAKGEMSYVSNENETVFMMVWGGMILHDGCMMMCENKRGAATNLFFHTTRDTQTMFFFKIEKKYHVKQKVEKNRSETFYFSVGWVFFHGNPINPSYVQIWSLLSTLQSNITMCLRHLSYYTK